MKKINILYTLFCCISISFLIYVVSTQNNIKNKKSKKLDKLVTNLHQSTDKDSRDEKFSVGHLEGKSGIDLFDKIELLNLSRHEKDVLQYQLIENLVSSNRFSEALDIVKSNSGIGSKRSALIFSLFTKYNEPLETTYALIKNEFKETKDFYDAIDGVSRSLVNPSGLTRVDSFFKTQNLDKKITLNLAYGLCSSLDVDKFGVQYYEDSNVPRFSGSALNERLDANKKLFKELAASNPNIASEATALYLKSASVMSPALIWTHFETLKLNMNLEDQNATASTIAKQYGQNDGEKALDNLLKSGITDSISSGLDGWMAVNSDKPFAWYNSNKSNFTPEQANLLASSFVQAKINLGSIAEANDLLIQITDPKLKKIALGKIQNAKVNELEKNVLKNPSETLNSFIASNKDYGDEMLEQAMGSWISREPSKAEEWYNQNWNKLSKAKKQYVAAAYANAAIKGKDLTTARKWLVYIEDEKKVSILQNSILDAETR